MKSDEAADIDAYIAGFPPDVRKLLERIRREIRKAAPGATEAIKYRMPTFVLNGNLVHFAAFKEHIGFYPTPSAKEEFAADIERYGGGKGTMRFPLDEPVPYDLIRRIVEFRVQESGKKAKAKKPAKKSAAKKTAVQ